MMNKKQRKVFGSAYYKMDSMCEKGFANGLTTVDFNVIHDSLLAMYENNDAVVHTILKNVADWFRKNNFVVKEYGIGWTINLP